MISLSCKSTHLKGTQQDSINTIEVEKTIVCYNLDSTTVKFKGIVTNVKNRCWVDGICSIEVDHKWWIDIKYGKMSRKFYLRERGKVTGIRFAKDNESIGKKVAVYAKIEGNKEQNKLTLEGSKTYYVETIE